MTLMSSLRMVRQPTLPQSMSNTNDISTTALLSRWHVTPCPLRCCGACVGIADDNDAPDVTIRNSGQDLVGELLQSFGFPALAPICQAVLQRLQEAGVTVKAPASVADVPAVAASLGVPSATWQLQEVTKIC